MSTSMRYWVAAGSGNWGSVLNWDCTSGGHSDSSLPTFDSTVYFDGNGLGNCMVNVPVSILSLYTLGAYSGTINQNGYDMTVGRASFQGGFFDGTNANIVIGTSLQVGGCGFTCTDRTLSLGGTLIHAPTGGGYFRDHGGLVSLDGSGANILATTDMTLSALQCNAFNTTLNGQVYVSDLILNSGSLGRSGDGTVHVRRGLYSRSGYNQWSTDNNMMIVMDGTLAQNIYNQSGSIIPMLYVNKPTTPQLLCQGSGPVAIRGDFLLLDGTMNSGGLDIEVGLQNFTEPAMVKFLDL